MATSAPPDVHTFEHHWQDEADAAYLYRILAAAEPDPKKKDIYARLADVEDRHVVVWGELLSEHGHPPEEFRPSTRARLLARTGKDFGPGFLLPMLLQEEGREVKAYLDMHRATPAGAPGGGEALTLAKESAEHATTLAGIAGKERRTVASNGIGRIPAERRVRIQRWTDREFRSGRRSDRRGRRTAASKQ